MKKSKLNLILIAVIFMLSGTYGFAQNGSCGKGNGEGFCAGISDLTQEQKDKIDNLRTAHQKSMLTFRNQLDVKNAQMEVLMTADKPDQASIDKMIEEIGALKISMQKKRAEHRLAVRNILTDKQKLEFDSKHGKRKGGGNCGNKGNCNGAGKGNGFQHRHGEGCGKNM